MAAGGAARSNLMDASFIQRTRRRKCCALRRSLETAMIEVDDAQCASLAAAEKKSVYSAREPG
jgi:hypothetical protein